MRSFVSCFAPVRPVGRGALLVALVLSGCDSGSSGFDGAVGNGGGGTTGGGELTGGGSGGGGCDTTGGGGGTTGGGGGATGGGVANQPPVWGALAPLTLAEGDTRQLTLMATDPEAQQLTFALLSPPPFCSLSQDRLTVTPDYTHAGTYTLQLAVTDGLTSVPATLALTVSNTNRTPSLSPVPDVNMTAGSTRVLSLVAADPDDEVLSFSAQGLPPFAALDGGVLTLTPALTVLSTDTVTVTVSDGTLSASDMFDIIVTAPVNQPPTLSALAQTDAIGSPLDAGVTLPSAPRVTAFVDDPEDAQVRLEVEATLTSSTFTNTPTQAGSLGAEGQLSLTLNTLPAGSYKWQARAVDAAGRPSAWAPFHGGQAAFTIAATAITGSVVVSGGAAVNSQSVSLTLSATSSAGAVTQMAFSNDGVSYSPDEAYVPAKSWMLSSGDGTKTVFVRFTDSAANTSVANDSIVLDTTAPQIGAFAIDNDAPFTNIASATLSFATTDTGSGVVARHAANDAVTFTAIGASPVSGWLLIAGSGTKTVTLRVTDAAGNTATATDTIVLDNLPPTVSSAELNDGGVYTASNAVSLRTVASDIGGSGLVEVCYFGNVLGAGCLPYASGGPYPITLATGDGLKTVTVNVRDAAGNISGQAADSITLDQTVPALGGLVVKGGDAYTTNPSVPVALSGASDSNGLSQMEFSLDGVSFLAPVAYAANTTFSLAGTEGLQTVYARVIDRAGNRSVVRSDSITLDTIAPTGTLSAPRATSATSVVVGITGSSDPSNVSAMCVKVTAVATPPAACLPADFVAFQPSTAVTVSSGGQGDKRVHVWLRDGAGNVSTSAATTDVFYDTTAPSAPSGLSALARNHGLDLSWTAATDTGSGIGTYEVGLSTTAGGPYVFRPVSGSTNAFVSASNGVTWYAVVRARDAADNVSAAVSNQASALPYWPWTWRQREPFGHDFTNVEIVDAGTSRRWVVSGEFGALFTSDDDLATWTRRDALTDARLNGLTRAAGALYVLGPNGLISRSVDNAATFQGDRMSPDAGVLAYVDLAVVGTSPTTTTLAAVTTTGEIARQTNGATQGTWDMVSKLGSDGYRGIAGCSGAPAGSGPCAGPNVSFALAVGNNGLLARSTDSGQTWSRVPPPTGYQAVNFSSVLHRPNTNEFYISISTGASSLGGMLTYDAASNTATPVASTPKANELKLTEDGQFVYVAGATTISRFPVGAPTPQTILSNSGALTMAGPSASVVAAFSGNGSHVLMTPNTGGFVQQNSGVTTTVLDLATRSNSTNEAWAVGAGGLVLGTTDTGATWQRADAGTTADLRGVASFFTPNTLYTYSTAVGGGGVFVRKINSNPWGVHPNTSAINPGTTMRDVACGGIAFTSGVGCFAVGNYGTIAELNQDLSVGEGAWTLAVPISGTNNPDYRAVARIGLGNQLRAVVVGFNGTTAVTRRYDPFSAWSAESTVPSTPIPNDVTYRTNAPSEVMMCGNSGSVRYSTDSGATWTVHSPTGFGTINFNGCSNIAGTASFLVAGSGGLLLKATRTGTTFTWATLNTGTDFDLTNAVTVSAPSGVAYLTGINGTVLYSATGGE